MYSTPALTNSPSTISAAVTSVSTTPISETWFGVTRHHNSTVATGIAARSKTVRK
jgi:hypothetical protein